MTVVYYVPSLAAGGLEWQVYRLVSRLQNEQLRIVVWTRYFADPIGALLRQAGVDIVVREFDGASSWLRTLDAAIFHSWSYSQGGKDVMEAHQAGIPVIITSRRNMRYWDKEGRVRPWEVERNSVTDMVIANCRNSALLARAIEGVPEERIRVIPNGVEIPNVHSRPTGDPFTVGVVAHFKPEKGHEYLLQALGRDPRLGDVHAVLLGNGPAIRAHLMELSRQLNLTGRVRFRAPAEESPQSVYDRVHAVVLPSTAEGMPNAVLEAMASGLPVAASCVGGIPEVIEHGVNGLLFPPADWKALGKAIQRLRRSRTLRARLAASARQHMIVNFNFGRAVASYLELYQELTDTKGAAG